MRQKTEGKRDAILEAAVEAFTELGYERTSMAEISARVGGSKATLYSYFPSKELLFVAATQSLAMRLFGPAFSALTTPGGDLPRALRRFGVRAVSVFCTPRFAATERMVIGEAGHSEIGRMFFESGPAIGAGALAAFLADAMRRGQLRRGNVAHATSDLMGLLVADTFASRHFALPPPTPAQVRASVRRAVAVFMAAYG